jgi:hypothetical protein
MSDKKWEPARRTSPRAERARERLGDQFVEGPYRWPPFEPGNMANLRHGATSPRKVAPIAAEIQAHILKEAPWCDQPAFAGALRSLAWTEAQIVLVTEFLDEHGVLRDPGVDELEPQPREATRLLRDLENRALKLRNALGLTPIAMSKMLLTLRGVVDDADDGLAALKAQGRAMLLARDENDA